ncbi:hypothetical protein C7444_101391 [Sphaerotilus hippei]|uniref:DUF2917 family protein n=1 Tax=Sphaerotilus hippei TaxID=744406 RepID=A0A318H726_9BURK|nr:DUF2917 domain-containing protein [Sphaerotilus hippei]PXW99561.1 hypothetical protein C7444_101391 [Sphaerotilus hippei]
MDTTATPTASADLPRTVDLAPGALTSLQQARGLCITVITGRVWLTEEGDEQDHFLSGGDTHVVAGCGRVVVEGLGPGAARLDLATAAGRSPTPERQPLAA